MNKRFCTCIHAHNSPPSGCFSETPHIPTLSHSFECSEVSLNCVYSQGSSMSLSFRVGTRCYPWIPTKCPVHRQYSRLTVCAWLSTSPAPTFCSSAPWVHGWCDFCAGTGQFGQDNTVGYLVHVLWSFVQYFFKSPWGQRWGCTGSSMRGPSGAMAAAGMSGLGPASFIRPSM